MITGHLPELFIILVIALIVFGPQRLPEVTKSVGGALREFRRATADLQDQVFNSTEADDEAEPFPHVPPEPDQPARDEEAEPEVAAIAPTIDTLAARREARQARATVGGTAATAVEPAADQPESAPA